MRIYIDTSALLRRVLVGDAHAADAESFLAEHDAAGDVLETSVLARIEVERALRARGAVGGLPQGYDVDSAVSAVLAGVDLIAITDEVATQAASLAPDVLRSLDAIHLATAILDKAEALVTYDVRQAAAAAANGLDVFSPGAPPPAQQ